jgi:hypothetical protein
MKKKKKKREWLADLFTVINNSVCDEKKKKKREINSKRLRGIRENFFVSTRLMKKNIAITSIFALFLSLVSKHG